MRTINSRILFGLVVSVVVIITVGVISAVTASNTVPATRADKDSIGISGDVVKPPQCAHITITNIVDYDAGQNGTSANDLILGTPGDDYNIRGGAGDDCILGGGGNDRRRFLIFWLPGIYGEDGDDVLIGGPGTDVCYGGGGSDQYYGCETEY